MTESKKRQSITRKKSRKEGGGGCISTGKGKQVCPDDITVSVSSSRPRTQRTGNRVNVYQLPEQMDSKQARELAMQALKQAREASKAARNLATATRQQERAEKTALREQAKLQREAERASARNEKKAIVASYMSQLEGMQKDSFKQDFLKFARSMAESRTLANPEVPLTEDEKKTIMGLAKSYVNNKYTLEKVAHLGKIHSHIDENYKLGEPMKPLSVIRENSEEQAKQALSELEAEMKKGGKRKGQRTRRHKK